MDKHRQVVNAGVLELDCPGSNLAFTTSWTYDFQKASSPLQEVMHFDSP